MVAGFYLYPALEVVRFSFTDATLLNPEYRYTTDTYRQVLTNPDLLGILRVTLTIVLAGVFFQITVGLLIALAMHRGETRNLPGTLFVRTIVMASCSWVDSWTNHTTAAY